MEGGRRQRVLVSTTIDLSAHQLFGRRIGYGANDHICGGQPADIADFASNSEVGEQDPLFAIVVGVGEHNVGGFDVAMK
ncbi:hypothetical protein A5660_24465 [Mycobacterium alsense]|nr:hypothetical protein A5660_24465 [Mycobacterium alsense]